VQKGTSAAAETRKTERAAGWQARGTDGEMGRVRERDTGEQKDGRCNGDGARVYYTVWMRKKK